MKLFVDTARCQGTALCVAVAPDVLAIQPDGTAAPVTDEVGEEFAADAAEAVDSCPMAALALVTDDSSR